MSYQIRNRITKKVLMQSERVEKLKTHFEQLNLPKSNYFLCEVEIRKKQFHVLEDTIQNL